MTSVPISQAATRGISSLVTSAEEGQRITLTRHGREVAEIVTTEEIEALREAREDLVETALILSRIITDTGGRTELDDLIEDLGLSRDELEKELSLTSDTGDA